MASVLTYLTWIEVGRVINFPGEQVSDATDEWTLGRLGGVSICVCRQLQILRGLIKVTFEIIRFIY